MRNEVIVRFANDREFELNVTQSDVEAVASDAARRWLDEQFLANECEPVRATGKVLTADKVLVLAASVGPERFEADPAWAGQYARATLAALGRSFVKVDVDGRVVTF